MLEKPSSDERDGKPELKWEGEGKKTLFLRNLLTFINVQGNLCITVNACGMERLIASLPALR